MTKEPFEKMDESLMKALKNLRERNVPPQVLKGFSASVTARIRQKEGAKEFQAAPEKSFVPVWVPVFAVLMIALVVVLNSHFKWNPSSSLVLSPAQLVFANVSDISDEIATLSELGAWTEEDEKAVGVSTENNLDDLDLTNASPQNNTTLV